MIPILFTISRSYDDQCVAQTTTPTPINGKKLIFVEVLTRHGARTPLDSYNVPISNRGYWQCDSDDAIAPRMHAAPVEHYRRFKQVLDQRLTEYLPNCRSGDLLLSGMNQHLKLGEAYHNYLYTETKLFDSETEEIPNPSTIYARCSDVERTFRSAQSFLHGVFPPKSPNEIIDVYSDTSDGSLLRPNKDWCKDMADLWNQHIESDEYKNWYSDNIDIVSGVLDYLGLEHNEINLEMACDYVTTHYCDDKMAPSVVNETIQQVCLKVTGSYLYDYYLTNPNITGSYSMRELMRIPKLVVSKQASVKFSFMSAHDTTVAAIHALLGGEKAHQTRVPPYASHLAIELWEDAKGEITIRFALNGKDIPLYLLDDQTEVPFNDFINAYTDYNNYCKEFR